MGAPARSATCATAAVISPRFERQVDPDGLLPEAERQRRALAARHAYFSALALKSARSRAARRTPPGHRSTPMTTAPGSRPPGAG